MSCHQFVCPTCDADIVVDADVRAGILEDGCPVCLAPVTTGDFRLTDCPEP